MTPPSRHSFVPFIAAFAGVALFSCMDAVMKRLSLAIGAYNALFWRSLLGTLIGGVAMVVMRYPVPRWHVLRVTIWRGSVVPFLALSFFPTPARPPLSAAYPPPFLPP